MKSIIKPQFSHLLILLLIVFFRNSIGELTQGYKDSTDQIIENLRKRDCIIEYSFDGGAASDTGLSVSVKQIRHHFGFGAAINWDSGFVKVGKEKYGNLVKEYFEWATPEDEMKWYYTDTTGGTPCGPQFYDHADSLVEWCLRNDINVRGHNLFWNERVEFQAYCARPYGPYGSDESTEIEDLKPGQRDAFIGEMESRLDDMVTRYKDKVKHWDAVNEIVHFTTDNSAPREVRTPGLLATWTEKTGNDGAEVFNWVMEYARDIDPTVKMCVNEYNVIEKEHDEQAYISMINKINQGAREDAKINIIGFEGHFGDLISRTPNGNYAGYEKLVNDIAEGVDLDNSEMEFWFTEVDWNNNAPGNTADNMEELLRFAFSREDFGGVLLWIWWEGRRWRDDLVSFLVDKNFNATETGLRWKELKDELWSTDTAGKMREDAKFGFRGFHGKYLVTTEKGNCTQTDTVYLEPGTEEASIQIELKKENFSDCITVNTRQGNEPQVGFSEKTKFTINGNIISFRHAPLDNSNIYFAVYSLNGKLISKTPLNLAYNNISGIMKSGCVVYRIETDNQVLYSNVGVQFKR